MRPPVLAESRAPKIVGASEAAKRRVVRVRTGILRFRSCSGGLGPPPLARRPATGEAHRASGGGLKPAATATLASLAVSGTVCRNVGSAMRRAAGWAAVVLVASAAAARAVTVERFTPQGVVKPARQATVLFSAPMVPFGDLRDVAPPFTVECPVAGSGRWVDARTWAYDFEKDLPGGLRCVFTARPDLASLAGEPLSGDRPFRVLDRRPGDRVVGAERRQRAHRRAAGLRAVARRRGDAGVDRRPRRLRGRRRRRAHRRRSHRGRASATRSSPACRPGSSPIRRSWC